MPVSRMHMLSRQEREPKHIQHGTNFSVDQGQPTEVLDRRKTDEPARFELENGRTVPVDPLQRAIEDEKMRRAGIKL
jgi:hypothetical protein